METWEFVKDKQGAIAIKNAKIRDNWEYVYENKDILLRVDNRGLVYAQANPTNDIYLFRRNENERFSKWKFWVTFSDGRSVNNFNCLSSEKALKNYITFYPEYALYFVEYEKISISTKVLIPKEGAHVICEVKIENLTKEPLNLSACASLMPMIGKALHSPWDKPEWYNKTGLARRKDLIEFYTRLNNAAGIEDERRMVTFLVDNFQSAEIRLEEFVGNGCYDLPDALTKNDFHFDVKELNDQRRLFETNSYMGYPSVYAAKGNLCLKPGENKVFTQVLSMQNKKYKGLYNESEIKVSLNFFQKQYLEEEIKLLHRSFDDIFSVVKVNTLDENFNKYINEFLPLQMKWVASLDRGWPTGLRGVRDASNDFMGMLIYCPERSKEILLSLYKCQRSDGWLPRQVSVVGKNHDMRAYSDSGAFLFEFLYQYLNYTEDIAILDTKLKWLDSEKCDSLLEHALRTFQYYLDPKNIGEHGLCKIYEGDWLDAVNGAGLQGRGESVMVSCQLIMCLNYAIKILTYVDYPEKEYTIDEFQKKAKILKENINKYAYNKKGFYNGTFCDDGKWLFSDSDEDGECRFYGCSNYYAIISGVSDNNKTDSVLNWAETTKTDYGYRLFWPALGKKVINCAGRLGSGDLPEGLFENGNIYNHGQGFRARALAVARRGDELLQTIKFILPYDPAIHPLKSIKNSPYAIVNCYQNVPYEENRGGMSFLTGTIAMTVRAVFEWMLGILPVYGGLCINPCLPKGEVKISVDYKLRNKQFTINYEGINVGKKPKIYFNEELIEEEILDFVGNVLFFIDNKKFHDNNFIRIFYQ